MDDLKLELEKVVSRTVNTTRRLAVICNDGKQKEDEQRTIKVIVEDVCSVIARTTTKREQELNSKVKDCQDVIACYEIAVATHEDEISGLVEALKEIQHCTAEGIEFPTIYNAHKIARAVLKELNKDYKKDK